jgi:hypothetical protein
MSYCRASDNQPTTSNQTTSQPPTRNFVCPSVLVKDGSFDWFVSNSCVVEASTFSTWPSKINKKCFPEPLRFVSGGGRDEIPDEIVVQEVT